MSDLTYPTSEAVVESLIDSLGLPGASVERLLAIPVILNTLIRRSFMDGYALAGPAALHGVYFTGQYVQRVPDELTFAPIKWSGKSLSPEDLLTAASAALPDGRVTFLDALGRATIYYRGILSPVEIPMRIETELNFEPDVVVRTKATDSGIGFLRDDALPYRGPVGEPVTVAVALAEELIARTLLALLDRRRTDAAARTDDLRIIFAMHPASARAAFAGPIRAAFMAQLSQTPHPEAGLTKLTDKMRSMISNCASDGALDASLRSMGAVTDWSVFEDAFIDALDALKSGR